VEEKPVMFFVLSKTVAYLLLPSNFLIVAELVGRLPTLSRAFAVSVGASR
jgi:hypothetical protein